MFDTHFKFDTHDDARTFFLTLQNQIKNMNFVEYKSDGYRSAFEKIEETLDNAKKY